MPTKVAGEFSSEIQKRQHESKMQFSDVVKSAHDLLFGERGGGTPESPPLYTQGLNLQSLDANVLASYYSDKHVIQNIQTILRYLFTVANDNVFPICHEDGVPLENGAIIARVVLQFSRIRPESIVGKRGAGSTYQAQKTLATTIVLSRFLADKKKCGETKDRHGLIKHACMVDESLTGFLLSVCNQSEGGAFYLPERDGSLKNAWTSIYRWVFA